jgi:hypothetical protein
LGAPKRLLRFPIRWGFRVARAFQGEFKGQMKVTKLVPLFLFLAGCSSTNGPLDAVEKTSSGGVLVLVEKLDLAENSYLLTPSAQDSFLTADSDLKQAMRSRAAAICGPAGVQFLDVDRPYYIQVELSPRGYLHCR